MVLRQTIIHVIVLLWSIFVYINVDELHKNVR